MDEAPSHTQTTTNVKSLIQASVAAAVVLNAVDWVTNSFLLGDLWRHLAITHNADTNAMNSTASVIQYVVGDTVLGVLLVWVYTAIRPRLGPGPATAIIAAFVVFAASTIEFATFAGWFVPWDLFVRTSALSLIALLLAGWAGAWVYKEEPAPEPIDWARK